jgi:O-Antigen ligase
VRPIVFTYLFCAIIVATLAGGMGGSYQPARVLVAGVGVLAVLFARSTVKAQPATRQSIIMAGILVLSGLVSLSWSTDLAGGVGMLLAVSVGALSLYIISVSDLSMAGVRLLMWAWVAAAGLSMPIAYYEIATGSHFQFAMDSRNLGGNLGEFPFAAIFFGNYNDFSTWLCLAFPITMAAFLEAKGRHIRASVAVLNILIAGVIFVNTSRAALAYVALVATIYFIKHNSFRLYASLFIAIMLPVFIIRYNDQILDLYALTIYRFELINTIDESYIQRSGLLSGGIAAIVDSFGLGVGLGGFEEYINDNYPYLIPNPHNIFLEIGVNFGFVPLLFFCALIIKLFMTGYLQKQNPEAFRLAVMLGAIAVPVIGTVPSQAIGYIYWWVWLATMVAMASMKTGAAVRVKESAKPVPGYPRAWAST